MSLYPQDLIDHLATGCTTLARAFAVTRRDGVVMGFTDHDRDLAFDGIIFRADSGLTAKALQMGTGLAVDNSEAVGALRSDAITEEDILAGRYDGAEVRAWLVNWVDVSVRALQFRGTLGEITRGGGAFTAELRGLSERLNQPQGRIYHARCSAVLGDSDCALDMGQPGHSAEMVILAQSEGVRLRVADVGGFAERWFEKGRLTVLDGPAVGLVGIVKSDRVGALGRDIELWQSMGIAPRPGDMVRLEAGCDKRAETCRLKFANLMNFRGFPDIPGDDWSMSYPGGTEPMDGGSRRA